MVVLAVAAILPASSFTGPNAAEQAKPQLRVVTLSPSVVAGTGFRPADMVRVNVRTEAGAASRKDVAGRRGGIGMRFARLKLDKLPGVHGLRQGQQGKPRGSSQRSSHLRNRPSSNFLAA
jgi:hypothetical protein